VEVLASKRHREVTLTVLQVVADPWGCQQQLHHGKRSVLTRDMQRGVKLVIDLVHIQLWVSQEELDDVGLTVAHRGLKWRQTSSHQAHVNQWVLQQECDELDVATGTGDVKRGWVEPRGEEIVRCDEARTATTLGHGVNVELRILQQQRDHVVPPPLASVVERGGAKATIRAVNLRFFLRKHFSHTLQTPNSTRSNEGGVEGVFGHEKIGKGRHLGEEDL